MNRALLIVVALMGCLHGWAVSENQSNEALPNIVLILADDLGFGDLSCNNANSKITTPHLDRLAAGGMNFLDAHSPSGVCTPTRYGVLTGRYCWRTSLKKGVLGLQSLPLIEEQRLTLPGMLAKRGYATGAIGKWHLGRSWPLLDPKGKVTPPNIDWDKPEIIGPLDVGFTYYYGMAEPAWTFIENRRIMQRPIERYDLSHIPGHIVGPGNSRGYRAPGFTFEQMLPAWVKKSKEFIESSAASKKPFFLYFAPMCPHRPINPNEEFKGKSKCGVYGDFVLELDAAVGQLMSALEKAGVADNTLIIFTADNGAEVNTYTHIKEFGHWSSGGLRGCKRDLYEGGHRVPFIASWPNVIAANKTSEEIICLTDIMATVANIISYQLPSDSAEDSYNLMPVLKGRKLPAPLREATVHHSISGRFAIRQQNWVYIESHSGADTPEPQKIREILGVKSHSLKAELFDLKQDPKQTKNLLDEHPDKAQSLKNILDRYRSHNRSTPIRLYPSPDP